MRKVSILCFIFATATFCLVTLWAQVSATENIDEESKRPSTTAAYLPTNPQAIYASRTSQSSLLNTSQQMVFGPLACTSNGDPFSPFTSPFRPSGYPNGSYTYRYRILIPPTYNHDTLRVELFDPDSYNSPSNNDTVIHSNYAQSNGFPAFESITCNGSQAYQYNSCLLATGENTLVSTAAGVTVDDINPYWFMRVDNNRVGCNTPGSYTPSANTTTSYQLSYEAQSADGTIQTVPLAAYTGLKDNTHNTDLHWVSPGGQANFDNVAVPVDSGSPKTFELNLNSDVPNIFTEIGTNNRYIYLDVTTVDGSSMNGYEIWAGPSDYVNTVPSQVNERNVKILDTPGVHDSNGVVVLADDHLPQTSFYDQSVTRPLGYFGPEYAGRTISLTLFDVDSGVVPPLVFTLDSIAATDWSLTFGVPDTIDPDGVPANSRCFPSCNNQFIVPSYAITLPGGPNCNPPNCMPFPGGNLLMNYEFGFGDNSLISLTAPAPLPYDTSVGCAAFPIGVAEGNRTVNPPGTGSSNDYPAVSDFEYPLSPPSYANFFKNVPDIPLQDAHEEYIYRVQNGGGGQDFNWLVWNGGIGNYTITLSNSLTWPGDTYDYYSHNDPGQPATPLYNYVVRGYVNPLDTSDLALNIDDWVVASRAETNNATIQDILNDHIDNGRLLRLVVWKYPSITQNGRVYWPVKRFGLFRLHGYNIDTSSSWLLAEFVRWDDSCGQVGIGPTAVSISGPTTGEPENEYSFTATISPTNTTQPITYTWTADGQPTITHSSGLADAVTYTWPDAIDPIKTITVTAANDISAITNHHTINLNANSPLFSVTISGPVTSTLDTFPRPMFTAVVEPLTATQPITYSWQATAQLPVSHTNGLSDTVTFHWLVPHTYTLVVTATNGVNTVTDSHQIAIYPAAPIPGCAFFPIGINEGARSVNPPGTGSGNDYPAPSDFYPTSPRPLYLQFPNTVPDMPLEDAQEGYVYKVSSDLGLGSMAWLIWNSGRNDSGGTLINSLTNPGNSSDYIQHNDGGVAGTPLYPYVVRGYVNPYDSMDLTMNSGDWLIASNSSANSASVRDLINDHIEYGDELRLPVWGDNPISVGGRTYIRLYGFAAFRLHGYNLAQTGGGPWLLVEFVRWEDEPCTEGDYPVGQVHLTGPSQGTTGSSYDFTAAVVPTMTNQPVTYTWSATEQTAFQQTAGITNTHTWQWDTPGTKTITLTAANEYRTATAVHTITLTAPSPMTDVLLAGPLTGDVGTSYAFTATVVPTNTTQPITYTWQASEQTTITHTNGLTDTAVFSWLAPGTKTITVTTSNSLGSVSATHHITLEQTLPDLAVGPLELVTTPPITALSPVTFQTVVTNLGSVAVTSLFYVDVYLDPDTVLSTTIPGPSDGYVAVSSLAGGASRVVTITAPLGFANESGPHWVYAVVDSLEMITETNETNNVSPPLVVTDVVPFLEPITAVTIAGPMSGLVDEGYDFTAVITPTSALQPITYTWQATDQTPITHVGGLTDTVSFTWAISGTQTITVTADNGVGAPVTAVHTFVVEIVVNGHEWHLYLPAMRKP